MKKLIISLCMIFSLSMLSSCGSVNFPPGKTYIEPDAGGGF